MFNEEGGKLEKWKEEIEKAEVPQEELEWANRQGFQRAEQGKKRPSFKRGV